MMPILFLTSALVSGVAMMILVTIIKDKYTSQSRGFGFVEMPNNEEGQAAIEGLNGKELDGRTLRVDEARPRDESRLGWYLRLFPMPHWGS